MVRLLILLAAITPPLIILSYGIAKARGTWRSEATWNAFLVGAVSAIAAIGCELALDYLLAGGASVALNLGTGIGHSVEDCLDQARWGMKEHLELLAEKKLPIPPPGEDPTVLIRNVRHAPAG